MAKRTTTSILHTGIAILVAIAPLRAQRSSAALDSANRLIAADQKGAAAMLLDAVVKEDPNDAQALMLLGSTRRTLGQVELAAQAFERAMRLGGASATPARRSLFLMYAAAGKGDRALSAYEQLRRAVDLTSLAASPDVAPLAGDDRFREIFPAKVRYDTPFVEQTRIIHEWHGEQAGDEFGWIARSMGDVDGDRVEDVVVSAPGHGPLGSTEGRIYAYSGRTGALLWSRVGAKGSLLGTGLERAGDVDRDGVPDVIAGAPGEGNALLLSGKDGHTIRALSAEPTDYYFGASVSGVGDVNGDGYDDVIVGAPYSAVNGRASGRAFVLSGKDGGRLLTLGGGRAGDRFGATVAGDRTRLVVGAPGAGERSTGCVYVYATGSDKPLFIKEAGASGVALGALFSSVPGDLDRDGVPDIYASDFSDSARGPQTGRALVFSGATGTPLLDVAGERGGEGFGIGAARAGDVNGDGVADLVIGSWQYSGAAWSAGRARVISGKDGSVLQTITSRTPGDTFGFDAVGIGDVDGDGMTDYLVTAAYSMVNGVRSGRTFIVAGTVKR